LVGILEIWNMRSTQKNIEANLSLQKNAGVALVDVNLADEIVKNQCGNEVQEDVVVSKLDRLVADRNRQRVVPLVSNLLDQLRQSVEDGTC